MFSCSKVTSTSFESSWRTEQEVSSSECQTEIVDTKEEECQVLITLDKGIQTEEEVACSTAAPEVNETSLLDFLRNIAPQVEKELDRAQRSRAFVGYSDYDESIDHGLRCIHTLRWKDMKPDHLVTCIDWSSSGSIIAVSYGVPLHEDWCKHKGSLALWNINRNDFTSNVPENVIETSTCIKCISFHPSNSSILAVGIWSGEILIFDLSLLPDSTPLITADCNGHPVTCITWGSAIPEPTQSPQLICSTDSGHILIWQVRQIKKTINLLKGFLITTDDIPREVRSRLPSNARVGIVCLNFNKEDSTMFVVGTEGGALLMCSTHSQIPSGTNFGGMDLFKCVTSSLMSHEGRVLSLHSSAFHRNAIHTLGSDNSLRLYTLLQPSKPLFTIYSEVGITISDWSPSRPLLIAVGTISGDILLQELGEKGPTQSMTIPHVEKHAPITTLKFNKRELTILAAGDRFGRVFLWQLPDSMVSAQPQEQMQLGALLKFEQD